MKTVSIPAAKCYACDAKATGVTRHGGRIEAACDRHADHSIKAEFRCVFCNGVLRKGSVDVDGMYAHKKCQEQAMLDGVGSRMLSGLALFRRKRSR